MIDAVIVKPEEMRECAQVAAQVRHTIHAYPEVGLNLTQTEMLKHSKVLGVRRLKRESAELMSPVWFASSRGISLDVRSVFEPIATLCP